MNVSQVCKIIGDTKISDSLQAIAYVKKVNDMLPVEHDIDVSMTGEELAQWFNSLPTDLKLNAALITLSPEEVQALKTELISLKEDNRLKEELDDQIKHNVVFAYTAVALAVAGFCVYVYLTTKGVDVEHTSQFLAGVKEMVILLIDISSESATSTSN